MEYFFEDIWLGVLECFVGSVVSDILGVFGLVLFGDVKCIVSDEVERVFLECGLIEVGGMVVELV